MSVSQSVKDTVPQIELMFRFLGGISQLYCLH